jgi:G6PDH family F420-dependent oxidoreductase
MPKKLKIGICPVIVEYDPLDIIKRVPLYEEAGFDLIWEGDHTLPWHHTNGHCSAANIMIEAYLQRTNKIACHYMVAPLGLRNHPVDVALQTATMAILHEGRVGLHVGTGEAMNENTVTGVWPTNAERVARVEEAIQLIKKCWTSQDYFTFKGKYFTTFFYLYDKPKQPIPLIGVAGGVRMAKIAGKYCDGILSLGPPDYFKSVILPAFYAAAREAGKDPDKMEKMAFVDTSYHPDFELALKKARLYGGVLIPECYSIIQDPRVIESRSALVRDDVLISAFNIASKPDQIISRFEEYAKVGVTTVIWAEISPDPWLTPKVCKEHVIPYFS